MWDPTLWFTHEDLLFAVCDNDEKSFCHLAAVLLIGTESLTREREREEEGRLERQRKRETVRKKRRREKENACHVFLAEEESRQEDWRV